MSLQCHYERGRVRVDIQRKGGGNVTTEAEIEVMWSQTKKFQQLPEFGRGKE